VAEGWFVRGLVVDGNGEAVDGHGIQWVPERVANVMLCYTGEHPVRRTRSWALI
jgi:hypothetical protein